MSKLLGILKGIPDPRQAWKIKHDLAEILLICIIGVTANANSSHEIYTFASYHSEWLKSFLTLSHGIPSRLTIERVLRILNPKLFNVAFMQIMRHVQSTSKGTVVAIDGKAYFNDHQMPGNAGVLYMVNAWCASNGMTLGQVKTQDKSNEITAIPQLLEFLDIKGATVTIDAIGCQREIVKQIVTRNKADYAIALKQNQRHMHDDFELYAQDCLASSMTDKYTHFQTFDKGHGRIEKRDYYLFHDISWFDCRKAWANMNGFIMVRSTRQVKNHQPTTETRYYITSLTSVQQAASAVRCHWGIENKLHWVLDVVFKEDGWKTKDASSASNLAVIRRLTANLLRAHPDKETSPIKRYRCSFSTDFLESVIFNPDFFS